MATVGIVGLGQMGILHASITNALQKHHTRAIAESDAYLARLARKLMPSINVYSNVLEMLDREELDAVYVCTPPKTHLDLVSEIYRNKRGLGVFVEKPLATNYQDALKLVELAGQNSTTMVGYQRLHLSVFLKTKEFLESKAIGDIRFFRGHTFASIAMSDKQGWRFEKGSGGVTLDFSSHLLALLIWLFGGPVKVESVGASLFSSNVEDFMSAIVKFQSGISGSITAGWSMRNYKSDELMIEVHGSAGTIQATGDRLIIHLDQPYGTLSNGVHVFDSFTLSPPVPYLLVGPELVLQDAAFLESVDKRVNTGHDFQFSSEINRFVDLLLERQSSWI